MENPLSIPIVDNVPIKTFKEHKWRFVNAFVYILVAVLYNGTMVTLTSISHTVMKICKIKTEDFLMVTSIANFGIIISSIVTLAYIHKMGVKNSLVIFFVASIAGYVCREFMTVSFYYLLAAQVIIGGSMSFGMNIKFALFSKWFAPENYKKVMSICVLLGMFGRGLMNLYPLAFVDESNPSIDELTIQVKTLYKSLIAITIFVLALIIILFKEEPPKGYGSLVEAAAKDTNDFTSIKKDLISMCKDKLCQRYIFVCVIVMTNLLNISDTLNLIGANYHLTQNQGSFNMTCFYGMGVLGAVFYDNFLEKKDQVKKYFLIYNVLGVTFIIICWISIKNGSYLLFTIFFSLSGFFLMNSYPLILSLMLKELNYYNRYTLNSIVTILPSISIIIIEMVMGVLVNSFKEYQGAIIFSTIIFLYLVALIAI